MYGEENYYEISLVTSSELLDEEYCKKLVKRSMQNYREEENVDYSFKNFLKKLSHDSIRCTYGVEDEFGNEVLFNIEDLINLWIEISEEEEQQEQQEQQEKEKQEQEQEIEYMVVQKVEDALLQKVEQQEGKQQQLSQQQTTSKPLLLAGGFFSGGDCLNSFPNFPSKAVGGNSNDNPQNSDNNNINNKDGNNEDGNNNMWWKVPLIEVFPLGVLLFSGVYHYFRSSEETQTDGRVGGGEEQQQHHHSYNDNNNSTYYENSGYFNDTEE